MPSVQSCLLALLALFAAAAPASAALTLVPGHLYAAGGEQVTQYDRAGLPVGSILVPGGELRGLVVSELGLIHVVQDRFELPPRLLTLGLDGELLVAVNLAAGIGGNLSYGKLTREPGGALLLCAGDAVYRFTDPSLPPVAFLPGGYDVAPLPDGTYLVAHTYHVGRYSAAGTLLATLSGTRDAAGEEKTRFANLRGLHYSSENAALFVTMLSGDVSPFSLMRLEPDTFREVATTSYVYADDIADASDGRIAVGSRTWPPAIFSADLRSAFVLETEPSRFVTVFKPERRIHADSFEGR